MLNRMCSEAELAVGMQSMISSSKRANVTLLFAPFGDGFVSFDLPQVPFPSVTPHAVKHSSPPSGTGLTPIRYTPKLLMNHERRFISKPFEWTYGSIKCDTLFHLQIHPAMIQAVGNCHSALRRGIQRTSCTSNSICGINWIPRRSAELKVAVKAMTVTDRLDYGRMYL